MDALGDNFFLDAVRPTDRTRFVELLNDPVIYQWTLRIPFPYRLEDADAYLQIVESDRARLGVNTHFAIREGNQLIGGCGFVDYVTGSHKGEIGYWMGAPWRGKGVMPRAVEGLVRKAFGEFGMHRLSGIVFAGNEGSRRVLTKCGFEFEGTLRQMYLKNGTLIDGECYARLRAPSPQAAC